MVIAGKKTLNSFSNISRFVAASVVLISRLIPRIGSCTINYILRIRNLIKYSADVFWSPKSPEISWPNFEAALANLLYAYMEVKMENILVYCTWKYN